MSMYKDITIYGVVTTGNTNINGELITGTTTINGDNVITGRLDVGQNEHYSTNWIGIHSDKTTGNGFSGTMLFSVWGGKKLHVGYKFKYNRCQNINSIIWKSIHEVL